MPSTTATFQEISITFSPAPNGHHTIAYLHFNFYNGATSTTQCARLIQAMDYILSQHHPTAFPIAAVVLMGSNNYFSNGIALNVIEASADPAQESWDNINAIDDVVHYLLSTFPEQGILTIAALRGNAAAGGVAMAAACDVVIAGEDAVLNPSYRALGLYGSEYHTLTYSSHCGEAKAKEILHAMTPMSPLQARQIGLVDAVFPGHGEVLEDHITSHVALLLSEPRCLKQGGFWKYKVDLSASAVAKARRAELGEMSKDFWSARATRYHGRRFDFVRKVKPTAPPLRFAKHRRNVYGIFFPDEEETPDFDDVASYRIRAEKALKEALRQDILAEMETPSTGASTAASTPEVGTDSLLDPFVKLGVAGDERKLVDDDDDDDDVRERNAKAAAGTMLFSCDYQVEGEVAK